jgi:predicted ABC-type ATPase
MWIIAGPNGAGKSTFVGDYLDEMRTAFPDEFSDDRFVKLNADERNLELKRQFPNALPDDLNRRAAQDIDDKVAAFIAAADHGFAVETVLSSPKYRAAVENAKAKGFRIGLIYVSLHPPEMSPNRVSMRAAKGGHDVEPAKAIDRYHRSHEQLRWFAPQADYLEIFDNSDDRPGATPVLLATRYPGRPLQLRRRGVNPAIDRVLADMAETKPRPPNPSFKPG